MKHIKQGSLKGKLETHLSSIISSFDGQSSTPILIAIGGPGGTGKSTLAKSLARELPDCAVLSLDDYKTPRARRAEKNIYGPHPDANELELILKHLHCLKTGTPFEKPVYCSERGASYHTEPFKPARYIIIDGEISTYKDFRHLIDLSIFVDSDWRTQLQTRISRDVDERNYSTDKAIATFLHSNLREFNEYGADSKKWSDIHIYCHDDYRLEIESITEDLYSSLKLELTDNMTPLDLSGLIVPLTTPFNQDMQIDEKSLIEHMEFLANHKVTRILVNGTTAEFFSLLPRERRVLLSVARRYFPGIIIFNTASDSLAQALEAGRWAEDFGVDAIAAMTPYYHANLQEDGLIRFFNTIAETIDLPMILYNFPAHTNNPITANIARNVPHLGIKDSGGDYSLIKATPHYFAGTSRSIVHAYEAGAQGFVSAEANHLPDLYVPLEKALKEHDKEQAAALQHTIREKCTPSENPISSIKQQIAKLIPHYPTACRIPLGS